jgi:hypothetical protein
LGADFRRDIHGGCEKRVRFFGNHRREGWAYGALRAFSMSDYESNQGGFAKASVVVILAG